MFLDEIPHCATCAHWLRPEGPSTVGTCDRVPTFLRRWRWLSDADAHDGCRAHDERRTSA